jgi:hypothetical protein
MNAFALHHQRASLEQLRGLAVGLTLTGLVAGCSVAASPSPAAGVLSFSPNPSTSEQASIPSPSSIPTETTTPTSIPSVGAAPAGAWSGLKWVSAGSAFPQAPVPDAATGALEVSVFGWSRGYVGFRIAFDTSSDTPTRKSTMVSTSSTDGVHWTPARPMRFDGLKDTIDITQVIEGPSGLLAVGHYPRAVCGGPSTVDALLASHDGLAWTLVSPPADFSSSSVYSVDGGSIGYIASGTLKDGVTQAIWLSADGSSWHRSPVPKPTTGTLVIDGGTSFASGYVVAGAVLGDEGCGGPSLITPSLWWSATGAGWARVKLTGATPANDATVAVTRISDHAVMAIATEWTALAVPTQLVWVSADGRAWSLVNSPSSLLGRGIITNGQRGLVVAAPPDNQGPPIVATVADDMTVTTLTQTGEGPVASDSTPGWAPAAFGPTGVVILSSDGTQLWLGVPTAS